MVLVILDYSFVPTQPMLIQSHAQSFPSRASASATELCHQLNLQFVESRHEFLKHEGGLLGVFERFLHGVCRFGQPALDFNVALLPLVDRRFQSVIFFNTALRRARLASAASLHLSQLCGSIKKISKGRVV